MILFVHLTEWGPAGPAKEDQKSSLKMYTLQFECQECQIFLILVEMLKNCNYIHTPEPFDFPGCLTPAILAA